MAVCSTPSCLQVLAYLFMHAGAVKQLALVDDLGRLLAVRLVGMVMRAC